MSSLDQNNPFNNSISEKQFNGYFVQNHNAKLIYDAIENGTAPFLPDVNGNVNTKAIFNGNTGFCVNAKDLIPLKIIQGDQSNMVVTYKSVQNAKTVIKEGEKGFFYNFQREDKTIGTSQFFFPEQTQDPQKVIDNISKNINKLYPNGIPNSNKVIEITSSDPLNYLSEYVAACKSGSTLKVSSEIAQEFKDKMIPILKNQTAKYDNKNVELDSLGNFMFKVDQKANEINKEFFAEMKRENQVFKPKQNNRKPVEFEQ